jgi:hypothetical protein
MYHMHQMCADDLFRSIQRCKSCVSYRTARPILTTGISPLSVSDHNERSEMDIAFAASRAVSNFGEAGGVGHTACGVSRIISRNRALWLTILNDGSNVKFIGHFLLALLLV